MDLFKSLCNCIKDDEVKAAKNILINAIKRKKRLESASGRELAPVSDIVGLVPSISAPASGEAQTRVASSIPVPKSELGPWWRNCHKLSDFVTLDCEMVSLHEKDTATGKHVMRAATVAIVDYKKNVLYQVSYMKWPICEIDQNCQSEYTCI